MKIFKFISCLKNLNFKDDIAIVIPSKKLLENKMGSEIDKHDDVIRFNNSTVDNYQEFVGKKTTFRIINDRVFFNRDLEKSYDEYLHENESIIVQSSYYILNKYKKERKIFSTKYFFFDNKYLDLLILIYFINKPSVFILLLKLILNKKKYSAGLFIILSLIILKKKITIYGLNLNENMKLRKYYYKVRKVGNFHNLGWERKILKKLYSKNLFKIS